MVSDQDIMSALREYGSERKAAKSLGMSKSTFHNRKKRILEGLGSAGDVEGAMSNGVKRFIVCAAQDKTPLCKPFFKNLKAYAEHLDAEITVIGMEYGAGKRSLTNYDELIREYITHERRQISPELLICGEMKISPTAAQPFSGLTSYGKQSSVIFGHTKVRLQTIPTGKYSENKYIYSTGAITQPNYIQKKAGLKAEFHHTLAALIVEVCLDGAVFVRQLFADKDYGFNDLFHYVVRGKVGVAKRPAAINWGDIHFEKRCPVTYDLSMGYLGLKNNLLDLFKPRRQFMHDLIDFTPRNHHNLKDHHHLFKMLTNDEEDIGYIMEQVSAFLKFVERDWVETVVVESNHDKALLKWLKEADYRNDPVNAIFFLKNQLRVYEALRDNRPLHLLERVLRDHADLKNTRFLKEDEDYTIEREGDIIQYGMHGHLGTDGSRGSPAQFASMCMKAVTGHTHRCGIIDGVFTAGVSGKLDMDYNLGPSSWSNSHVMTYDNLKRVVLIKSGGRFFADQFSDGGVGEHFAGECVHPLVLFGNLVVGIIQSRSSDQVVVSQCD